MQECLGVDVKWNGNKKKSEEGRQFILGGCVYQWSRWELVRVYLLPQEELSWVKEYKGVLAGFFFKLHSCRCPRPEKKKRYERGTGVSTLKSCNLSRYGVKRGEEEKKENKDRRYGSSILILWCPLARGWVPARLHASDSTRMGDKKPSPRCRSMCCAHTRVVWLGSMIIRMDGVSIVWFPFVRSDHSRSGRGCPRIVRIRITLKCVHTGAWFLQDSWNVIFFRGNIDLNLF